MRKAVPDRRSPADQRGEQGARARDLGSAIGHYFAYRVGMLERDLSDLFRVAWRSLAIGIAVLAVCIGLSQIVRTALPEWAAPQLLAEGIMIFGWVANWRPAEILIMMCVPRAGASISIAVLQTLGSS
jgi:hypothetical protein